MDTMLIILAIVAISLYHYIVSTKLDNLYDKIDKYQAQIGMLDDEISQLREFLKE